MPRITASHMLRSTVKTVSAPAISSFRGSIPHPRNRCVRFVFGVTAASRNTRFQAARYSLTWAGLAPADRASFAWRFPSLDHPELLAHAALRSRCREASQLAPAGSATASRLGLAGADFLRLRCPIIDQRRQRRFPEPFVREIEERFGDCLDSDHSAGRGNGMSGIVAGKQPNEAERVHRSERAPRRGLDCRPKVRAEPHR